MTQGIRVCLEVDTTVYEAAGRNIRENT